MNGRGVFSLVGGGEAFGPGLSSIGRGVGDGLILWEELEGGLGLGFGEAGPVVGEFVLSPGDGPVPIPVGRKRW